MHFTIKPTHWESSSWWKFINPLLNLFFHSHLSLVYPVMIHPVVENVFKRAETSYPPADASLRQAIEDNIRNLNATIYIGDCPGTSYAQADAAEKIIHINSEWAIQSQHLFEEWETISFSLENVESYACQLNLIFSLMKFMHECFHLFTPFILEAEFEERRKVEPEVIKYINTPIKVGTKKSSVGFLGDMGFQFEQILLGSNLRLYLSNPGLKHSYMYFERVHLTEPVAISKEGSSEEPNARKSTRLIETVGREVDYNEVKFTFHELNGSKEVDYIRNILNCRHEVIVNPSTENIRAIVSAFLVDSSSLKEIASKKGFEGKIPVTLFSRKNSLIADSHEEHFDAFSQDSPLDPSKTLSGKPVKY